MIKTFQTIKSYDFWNVLAFHPVAEKQQKIRESVVHFEKFVKENDVKRARAMKKERDEINACKQKEQEIIALRQELQQQSEKKEQITHTLNKLLVYDA